jgi:hypothetical protein
MRDTIAAFWLPMLVDADDVCDAKTVNRSKLVPVTPFDLGCALSEFGLEPSPCALVVVRVLIAEQPECLFSTERCHTSKVFHAEAVENLSPLEIAHTQTERAFDLARD